MAYLQLVLYAAAVLCCALLLPTSSKAATLAGAAVTCDDVINDDAVARRQTLDVINRCWKEHQRKMLNSVTSTNLPSPLPEEECPELECGDLECLFGRREDETSGCETCECNDEIFQGDIRVNEQMRRFLRASLLPPGGENEKEEEEDRSGRGRQRAVTSFLPLWKAYKRGSYYVVPYVVDESIGEEGRDALEEAIGELRNLTCIRVEPRGGERKYLKFVDDQVGCLSAVGMTSPTEHAISLSKSCWTRGTIVHEILHALGFWHEHSRPDRDSHVKILYHNVATKLHHNFVRFSSREINSYRSGYDLGSVMQYSSYAFSRNGRPTMVDRSTGKAFETQRDGMSQSDVEQVNALYGCPRETERPNTRQIAYTARHCVDERTFCFAFAIDLDLQACRNQKFAQACCASCRMAARLRGTTSSSSSTSCQRDKHPACGYWKNQGMCEKNASLMKKYCCRQCRDSNPLTIDWDLVL